MDTELRAHYLTAGTYTYAGQYMEYYQSLPSDVRILGTLICSQVIHRKTLKDGNTNANQTMLYGDMTQFPWYRMRCEDDIFLTSAAMTAELFRLDEKGFTFDRKVEHKLVVCCRAVSVLMSAILKAKRIPCRSRAGFAPYLTKQESWDHWINQYWDDRQRRWITFDADAFFDPAVIGFDQYDMPEANFDWSAPTWLAIRNGSSDGSHYIFADCNRTNALEAAARYLLYDFHAIMNHELTFSFQPWFLDHKFQQLSENELSELDELATLMLEADLNFQKLKHLWNTKKRYRIISGPLVGDQDNAKHLKNLEAEG